MDIRPFLDQTLHMTVWYKGQCKNCHAPLKEKIYDYGVLKYAELEKKMDETNHPITPFKCKKCGTMNLPESLLYVDELRNLLISELTIPYGHTIDGEQAQKIEQAQRNRFNIFKEKEEDFWRDYTDIAIANWRDFVNELGDFEIRDAFSKLHIQSTATTANQLRREVLNRIQKVDEKQTFWKFANEYFVYQHLLDIGPLGWIIEEDIKYYGQNRMRFIILHFPLDESFEQMRTEWIGKIIKKQKGDNDFLFRRISMLTEELNRTRKKMTKYVHQIEELKIEKANLQNKLSDVYADLRKEKEHKEFIRDPYDIHKIRELKSLIHELMEELKEKEREILKLNPPEKNNQSPPTLEEETNNEQKDGLEKLEGKIVAIIGGQRQEQASTNTYPCKILTHTGEQLDPDFYKVLKEADVIVVLTQFISHISMWESKAYAIEEDKPIYFVRGLNIGKILLEIARK